LNCREGYEVLGVVRVAEIKIRTLRVSVQGVSE